MPFRNPPNAAPAFTSGEWLDNLADMTAAGFALKRIRDRLDELRCHAAAADVSMAIARLSQLVGHELDTVPSLPV